MNTGSVDTLSEKEGFLTFGIKPYIKKNIHKSAVCFEYIFLKIFIFFSYMLSSVS